LPYAHRGHCKDEDSYKECSSHVELSIDLTISRPNYSAIKGGIIRPNSLAFLGAVPKKAGAMPFAPDGVGYVDFYDGKCRHDERKLS
jgi:hypothetical protein